MEPTIRTKQAGHVAVRTTEMVEIDTRDDGFLAAKCVHNIVMVEKGYTFDTTKTTVIDPLLPGI
ncbi:MAG: hypothetical protein NZ744_08180, partial [Pirellulaceae bacterium]|nr:hypothetical protein [Pirellulaceae bacterium]